jgi:integrase
MQDYVDNYVPTLRSADSLNNHALRIGRWLVGRTASETRAVVAQLVEDLKPVYAPATINRSLSCLSKALSRAWKRGDTATDYSNLVEALPVHNERTVYLSLDQVKAIADKATPRVRAAIWLSLFTGCRRGEILKLKPEDIGADILRLEAGNTKTLKYREVPIVTPVRPWLAQVPLKIAPARVSHGFKDAARRAGFGDVRFHDLRRSCGTLMLQAGVAMHVVSKILGHSSVRITEKRYAFLDSGSMRDAMEKTFGGGA